MLDKYRSLLTAERLQQASLTIEEVEYVAKNCAFYKNDVFRFVLASNDDKSKRILTYVVELIIKQKVLDIVVCESEPVKELNHEKGIRMDVIVKCLDKSGKENMVNLEIQNYGSMDYVSLRSQVYASKMVVSQVKQGNHTYEFNNVFQVMFLTNVKRDDENYYHEYVFMDENHKNILEDNRIHLVFVELDKLEKLDIKEIDRWSEIEQLGYVMRFGHLEDKCDIIKALEEKNEVLKVMLDKKDDFYSDMIADLNKMKAMFDKLDREDFERKLEEAKVAASKIAREQALKEGREKTIREILVKMHNEALPIEMMAKFTNLSIEEVEKIIK